MKYQKFFTVMLIMILLSGISALLPSLFLQFWNTRQQFLSIQKILFLVLVITFSKVVGILLTIFREHYAREYNKKNFYSMLESSFQMDYDSILSMGPSNILDRIFTSVNHIYFYMTGDYIKIWSGIIIIIACLGIAASVNRWLAVLLFIMVPVNYVGYRLLNKELAKRSLELQKNTGEGFQEILSYSQQVDYIKQSADHNATLKTIASSVDKIYFSMARINVYAQSVSSALVGLNDLVQNFILMVIVYNFFIQNSGPYTLMLTSIILPLYFSNVSLIVGAKLNQNGFKTAQNFYQELLSHKEPDGDQSLSEITQIHLAVDELIINGKKIPFHAQANLDKGDIVQICGESGCGKSTFAKALLKFRPISQVSYNGIPIKKIKNHQLRSRIEYLSQNVPIVHGTLADNLFLNTKHTPETERSFMQEPLLQSIFSTKSMDSNILEGGANLSAGEKQKIALARVLNTNPDVLILDEVCSNIDREAAYSIYERLRQERHKRITFIISHDTLPKDLANIKINESSFVL